MINFIEQNQIIIFSVMGLIVLSLSVYFGILAGKVNIQKKQIEKATKEAVEKAHKRELSILESIEIISKGVIQDQCEISEGCLRIKNLKDQLEYFSTDLDLSSFDQMYSEIEQFATLEARKALSKQERFDQDKKRFKVESEYEDKIKEASKNLLDYVQNKLKTLSHQ